MAHSEEVIDPNSNQSREYIVYDDGRVVVTGDTASIIPDHYYTIYLQPGTTEYNKVQEWLQQV